MFQPFQYLSKHLSKDDGHLRQFLILFLSALLLRLLLLPFFGHIDFFSEHRRIFNLYQHGDLFWGSRFITSLVEYINFIIVSPLLAEKSSMFMVNDLTQTTASHLQFFSFTNHHAILRTFFLLKLPYLLFDLLFGIFLYRHFNNKNDALRAVSVWFFNPITLFSFYIFSRFESIPLFFLGMAIMGILKEKPVISCLMLGLSLWGREVNLTLLPLFLLYIVCHNAFSSKQKVASVLVLTLFFSLAFNLIPMAFGVSNRFRGVSAESVASFSQSLSLIGFQINWYYPFISIYTLICFWIILKSKLTSDDFLAAVGIYYCSFFIFVIHSVHYVAWPVVVFAILSGKHARFIKPFALLCCSWILFWLVATDLGVFTHWLAIPSSLFFSNIPTIPSLIENLLLPHTAFKFHHLVFALRSIYAAAFVLCAFQFYLYLRRESKCQS